MVKMKSVCTYMPTTVSDKIKMPRYSIYFGEWRVLTGRQESIELSFMLVGHTKFSPDRHFGTF
jgi:hypothetical protein